MLFQAGLGTQGAEPLPSHSSGPASLALPSSPTSSPWTHGALWPDAHTQLDFRGCLVGRDSPGRPPRVGGREQASLCSVLARLLSLLQGASPIPRGFLPGDNWCWQDRARPEPTATPTRPQLTRDPGALPGAATPPPHPPCASAPPPGGRSWLCTRPARRPVWGEPASYCQNPPPGTRRSGRPTLHRPSPGGAPRPGRWHAVPRSYQLLLALDLVHRLPLQLLLGAQRGHAVSLQALGLLLGAPPLLLQLQGALDLVRELCQGTPG